MHYYDYYVLVLSSDICLFPIRFRLYYLEVKVSEKEGEREIERERKCKQTLWKIKTNDADDIRWIYQEV